jgi:multidrug efflux system outer membrane protein
VTGARHRSVALACLALLSGCSLAPRYHTPDVVVSEGYREAAGDWQIAAATPLAAPGSPWWKAFGDAQLDALEEQLLRGNPDLQGAAARYAQARAIARQAGAARLPAFDAGASATRGRSSANAPRAGGVSSLSVDYDAGLQFAWELDLFGSARNTAASAGRRAEATAADVGAAQLALGAELASRYFALRGADAALALLDDTTRLYDRALALTRNRYSGGVAAATDVDQAQTQLQDARAQQAVVRFQRAIHEHAIAVLLGLAPAQFALAPAPGVSEAPAIAPLLPSALLLRRPDIAAAERRVAAANAEIGVARAAWFPVFSLRASGGYEATTTAAWFDAPSRYWAIGPAAVFPLLGWPANSARTSQARAAFDEAAASYRQTVLVAWREVEDQLAALHYFADEAAAEDAAAESARSAALHARRRYEGGVADYVEVTSTQSAALQAQRAALEARVQRLDAAVALLRALGGDWRESALAQAAAR